MDYPELEVFLHSEGMDDEGIAAVWEALRTPHVMAVEINTMPTWKLTMVQGEVQAEKIP